MITYERTTSHEASLNGHAQEQFEEHPSLLAIEGWLSWSLFFFGNGWHWQTGKLVCPDCLLEVVEVTIPKKLPKQERKAIQPKWLISMRFGREDDGSEPPTAWASDWLRWFTPLFSRAFELQDNSHDSRYDAGTSSWASHSCILRCQRSKRLVYASDTNIRLMEEIPNNHLGCIKPCK